MKQFKFKKINNEYFTEIKCPDCGKNHLIAHKNYYAQKKGKRNLSFRCSKCGRIKAAKTWRDPNRKFKHSAGYIMLYRPENSMSDKGGRIYEHRLVMSEIIGRPLKNWEHVHHKNGNRADNRPENLELHPNSEHQTIRFMKDRIEYLESILIKHHISF